jgi:hypothetical protein
VAGPVGALRARGNAAILILDPLLTAAFLRAGALGGLLTPASGIGSAAGTVVALAINSPTGAALSVVAASLICAAGGLAITQRAPLWAGLFVWKCPGRGGACWWFPHCGAGRRPVRPPPELAEKDFVVPM